MSPWEVLGIQPTNNKDEIKKAYRAKMKEVHPDLHPEDKEATQKTQRLNMTLQQILNPQPERKPIPQPRQGAIFVFYYSSNNSTYSGTTTSTFRNW
jgi:molecular chaperone DnaJ